MMNMMNMINGYPNPTIFAKRINPHERFSYCMTHPDTRSAIEAARRKDNPQNRLLPCLPFSFFIINMGQYFHPGSGASFLEAQTHLNTQFIREQFAIFLDSLFIYPNVLPNTHAATVRVIAHAIGEYREREKERRELELASEAEEAEEARRLDDEAEAHGH